MRGWSLPRPRVLLVAAALAVVAALVALTLRPESVPQAVPTTLPEARTDLAASALSDWLAERAAEMAEHGVPIGVLGSRVIAQNGAMQEDGTWSASASLTWKYVGIDRRPSTVETTVQLRTTAGGVTVVGLSRPGRVPLWAAGPADVARSATTVVVGADGVDVAAYDRWARNAVEVVRRVLPGWTDPLVVEVPDTSAGLESALGATTGTYTGVAAVTAAVDGAADQRTPVRVVVNPAVMATLDDRSSQVVISHEATHVATSAVRLGSRPLWLSEGFADYVALRDVEVPLATSAGQIAARVRAEGVPAALPSDAQFTARSAQFGAEYEAAWQVCVEIAERSGEAALVQLYQAVGAGTPVETAVRRELGYSLATLTRNWQARLAALPGATG